MESSCVPVGLCQEVEMLLIYHNVEQLVSTFILHMSKLTIKSYGEFISDILIRF